MSLATIFNELVDAIDRHGRALVITDEVRAVMDRHDMLAFDRSDDACQEVDFGLRRGEERLVAHFFTYPATDSTPPQACYDVDWTGIPSAPGVPAVEKRSWQWHIATRNPRYDEPAFSFLG